MTRNFLRTAALSVLLGVVWVGQSHAAPIAQVLTNDGETFEGEVVRQTPRVIVLNIAGINATIEQDRIKKISLRKSPREIYRKERAALEDSDLEGRLKLAEKMYEMQSLNLAKIELAALERDFPDNNRTLELNNLVNAKEKLKQGDSASKPSLRERVTRIAPGRAQAGAPVNPSAYLTDDQIKIIQVYEVDLTTRPKITIPRAALDEFFKNYSDRDGMPRSPEQRRAFARLPGYQQLDFIFKMQARDVYSKVTVRPEPKPLQEFRQNFNPGYISRYFQPTFGSGQIKEFELLNSRPETSGEAYTNFYLLTRAQHNGVPFIDRFNPEESLLVQWGLPRDRARYQAPDVEGWRPQFRSTDDRQFLETVKWIESLLFNDNPDYGFEFTLEIEEGDE